MSDACKRVFEAFATIERANNDAYLHFFTASHVIVQDRGNDKRRNVDKLLENGCCFGTTSWVTMNSCSRSRARSMSFTSALIATAVASDLPPIKPRSCASFALHGR